MSAPLPPLQLLYAEDSPQDADLTRMHFESEAADLRLEIVGTGVQCLERLAAQSFDVLLLDNHLPDMDGLDVLAKLRAAGHTLPVVMVTGVGDDELVAQALRAGAADYVPKAGDYLATLPGLLRGLIARQRRRLSSDGVGAPGIRQILYVEPHAMDAEMTAEHFATAAPHLRLHVVPSCLAALELLGPESVFDLVLTDLRVPGMNALEFLHEARRRGIELPFIVITGRGDEATAVALLRLGAADYLVKRENYLTQLPHAIDHALHRFLLDQTTRRLHAELAALNASLEEKVRTRTAELQREIAERTRAEREVRELLATAEQSRTTLQGLLDDQERTGQALRESEERHRSLIETTHDLVQSVDASGRFIFVNRAWCETLGWTPEEARRLNFCEVIHPDMLAHCLEVFAQLQQGAHYDRMEVRFVSKSGREVLLEGTLTARFQAGQFVGTQSFFRDITERQRAEAEVARQRAELELILDTVPALIFYKDRAHRLVRVNAAHARALGRPRAELEGRTDAERGSPHAAGYARDDDEVLRTGQPKLGIVEPVQTAAGTRWLQTDKLPYRDAHGAIVGVLGFALDITERREAEAALARQHALLTAVVEGTGDAIFAKDREGRYQLINTAGAQVMGRTVAEVLGRTDAELLPAEVARHFRETDDEVLVAGQARLQEEVAVLPTDTRYFLANKAPWRDAAGRIIGLIGVAHDITERKRAEAALREREEQLRLFVEHAPAAIAMFDPQMRYLAVSRRWLADYGLTGRDLRGQSHYDVFPEISAGWKEIHRRCLAGAVERADEDRFERGDGSAQWLRWEVRSWTAASGAVGGLIIFSEDITARKQAEAALAESRQRLALATESAQIGVWDWDVVANKLIWDARMYALYGLREPDFGGAYEAWEKGLHPEDRSRATAAAKAALAGTQDYHTQFRVVWPNGEVRHIEAHGVVQRAANGAARRMIGVNWDITARQQAEETNSAQAALLDSAHDAIIVRNAADEVVFWNDGAERTYGWTREDVLGRVTHDLLQTRFPKPLPAIKGELAEQGVWEGELTHRCKDGGEIMVDTRWVVHRQIAGGLAGTLEINRDITERKRAEAAVLASEQRLRSILDTMFVFVGLMDLDGRIVEVNEAPLAVAGLKRPDVLGRTVPDSYWFSHSPAVQEQVRAALARAARGEVAREDYSIRIAGGQNIIIDCTFAPLRDAAGQVAQIVGSAVDITEREHAEAALRESEARFVKAFHANPAAMCITTMGVGRFLEVNERYCRLIGLPRDQLVGQSSVALRLWVDPAVRAALVAQLRAHGSVRDHATQFQRADGTILEAEISMELIEFPGEPEPVIISMFTDITERLRAEREREASRAQLQALLARLQRAREAERIRVSREIHDELGQLLTGLKMDVRWLERKLSVPGLPPAFHPLLDRAVAASELADATIVTVQKIAAELRSGTLDDLGLEAALHQKARGFQTRTGLPCVLVAAAACPELPPEIANELFYICQEALTNVARHAHATRVEIHLRTEGDAVVLEVRDDGVGLAAADLRAPRSLGLTGMRERAAQCGGTVAFERNEPRGTRVVVRVAGGVMRDA